MNLFVQERGTDAVKRLTEIIDRDIANYFWGDKNTVLFLKDNAGDENYHYYSVNINDGAIKELTPYPGVRVNLVDELEDIEGEILIEVNKRNPEIFDV